jgi:hypothetical protein
MKQSYTLIQMAPVYFSSYGSFNNLERSTQRERLGDRDSELTKRETKSESS